MRDNYAANHVIIGEPSGYNALTLGYFGLTKLKLTISKKENILQQKIVSVLLKCYSII